MKRLITAVIIATCLTLCAAVWPQAATVEETPMPTPAPAVTAPEPPATGVKFEAEIDPPTEKEKGETSQSESPHEPINEPKPEAVEALRLPKCSQRLSRNQRPNPPRANGRRSPARRHGLCGGLRLAGVPGAESLRIRCGHL